MSLRIISFEPISGGMLYSAPNVTDSEIICNALENDDTPSITEPTNARLDIITTYRGNNLYCKGGVTVFRVNPTTPGGNGFTSMPSPGTEETVEFSTRSGLFRGRVKFE